MSTAVSISISTRHCHAIHHLRSLARRDRPTGCVRPSKRVVQLCDRVANVVNELNALDTVEIAFARTTPSVPSVPFLTQASDIVPTTVVLTPPHLGPSSAGGMNSPDYTGYLPTSWISAFRGSSVGVIDIEWDFTAHEKLWCAPNDSVASSLALPFLEYSSLRSAMASPRRGDCRTVDS